MAVSDEDLAAWRGWIGRSETRREILGLEPLRRYALAIGADRDVEQVWPALGHWAFFLPQAAGSELGPDGHPARGGFLPPIALPRRMFAAAEMEFLAPLQPGEPAELTSVVTAVDHREARSGELVLVTVERTVRQDGKPRLREQQTLIYRGDGGRVERPPMLAPPTAPARLWTPGPVELFRFSAATFNAHRIHYDQAYATEVEGYPDMVVQGPFTAAMLFGLLAEGRAPAGFAFRAQAPLFAGQPVRLEKEAPGVGCARRCDGQVAMTARLSV